MRRDGLHAARGLCVSQPSQWRGKKRFPHYRKSRVISLIVWLIVGGLVGWVASLIMGTDAQQGPWLNIVVGVVGAFLAGLVLSPLVGIGTLNQGNFSLPALLVSLVGSVILLAVVNLFRRGMV
jgi:uncharacterized membrane protein YeaQ/YmgE (transglycosylase-associated protein family)